MPEATQQWEYRVQSVGKFWGIKDQDIETLLNEWGEEGWEAVAVFPASGGNVTIVAKRPLTLATRRRRSMPGIRAEQ